MNFTGITMERISQVSREAARELAGKRKVEKEFRKDNFDAFGFVIRKWRHEKAGMIDSQGKVVKLMEIEG